MKGETHIILFQVHKILMKKRKWQGFEMPSMFKRKNVEKIREGNWKSQLGHERIQKIIHSLFSNVLYMVNKRNSLFNNYGLTWSRWCGWRRYSLPVCPIQIRQPSNLIFAIYIYISTRTQEKWEDPFYNEREMRKRKEGNNFFTLAWVYTIKG